MGHARDDAAPQRDEIAEKCVYWTSATVDRQLRTVFSEGEVRDAAIALAALAPDPGCPPEADETACRLMLAAICASDGDVAKLAMWVAAARNDPRDVIAVAEYRGELIDGDPSLRDSDLDGYLAWVRGEAR